MATPQNSVQGEGGSGGAGPPTCTGEGREVAADAEGLLTRSPICMVSRCWLISPMSIFLPGSLPHAAGETGTPARYGRGTERGRAPRMSSAQGARTRGVLLRPRDLHPEPGSAQHQRGRSAPQHRHGKVRARTRGQESTKFPIWGRTCRGDSSAPNPPSHTVWHQQTTRHVKAGRI